MSARSRSGGVAKSRVAASTGSLAGGLTVPVQFWVGAEFYAGAWRALRGTPMPTANAEIRWENIPIQWLEAERDSEEP